MGLESERGWRSARTPVVQAWGLGSPLPKFVPNSSPRDRGQKREIYQRAGVLSYWIVDVDARLVEHWSPGDERPEILRESVEWSVDDESLGRIDLPVLFAEIG